MNATSPSSSSGRWLPRLVILATLTVVVAAGAWFMVAPAKPAPQASFTSLQGETFTTESLRGKVVLVNFWATSCVTCVRKMPMITESFETFGPKGYEVVAVAMQYDRPDYVVQFAESRKLPFKVALDTKGEIARAFGEVRLTPTSFLIDRKGHIVKRYLGDVDQQQFFADVEQALRS